MRNPNGYGSITKLGGNRRKPYWIRKTVGFDDIGNPISKTIGFAETKEEANIILAEYNKNPFDVDATKMTLSNLFDLLIEKKQNRLSEATLNSIKAAFKYAKKYQSWKYVDIKAIHMQDVIDSCNKNYATQGRIKNMFYHLDRFALEIDLPIKNYSTLIEVDSSPETSRKPFTKEEIQTVWEAYQQALKDNDLDRIYTFELVLMYLYTGFRFNELKKLKMADIDLENKTLIGGLKTKSGKNRLIPIHSRIYSIFEKWYDPSREEFISDTNYEVRKRWEKYLKELGIDKTPHECRHTFETLLDAKNANRRCIDLLMGHTSKDIGNRVYNHKTIEELRETIELLE